MKGSALEGLMNRLDRVERENRRLKEVGSVVLVAVASLVLMGQAVPNVAKVVEAERFVLRDASGKLRAELAVDDNGAAYLSILDREGKGSRAMVAVLPNGSGGLVVSDREGKATAQLDLGLFDGDKPGLRLFQEGLRAELALRSDGTAHLSLSDKGGKVIWQAP